MFSVSRSKRWHCRNAVYPDKTVIWWCHIMTHLGLVSFLYVAHGTQLLWLCIVWLGALYCKAQNHVTVHIQFHFNRMFQTFETVVIFDILWSMLSIDGRAMEFIFKLLTKNSMSELSMIRAWWDQYFELGKLMQYFGTRTCLNIRI